MAAPTGNQFWKIRSKHGRDRVITEPEELADMADEYFNWCVNNPIITYDYKGKDAEKVQYENPRVFQKGELARFCGLAQWRSIEELKDVKGKEEDFLQVITRIEGIIADQKYAYAVINVFNSNIVARDLGLADNKNINNKGAQPVVIQSSNDDDQQALQDTINND